MNSVYLLYSQGKIIGAYSSESFAIEAAWECVRTAIHKAMDEWQESLQHLNNNNPQRDRFSSFEKIKAILLSKTDFSSLQDIASFIEQLRSPKNDWERALNYHMYSNENFRWQFFDFSLKEISLNEQITITTLAT
jgi:hypothetical protein